MITKKELLKELGKCGTSHFPRFDYYYLDDNVKIKISYNCSMFTCDIYYHNKIHKLLQNKSLISLINETYFHLSSIEKK